MLHNINDDKDFGDDNDMVDIHGHVNLHIIEYKYQRKPLMKKIQPESYVQNEGNPLDEAHE